ncbi:MAG: chromosome segregation protein SMC [Clostridia bacterium]|nr:chromosome segregation protein SMC [Clostridia bacterium]
MILKSLEIQGFKSFPDKTVLSFGSGITAVVGPNGSGKSNISDAIRWVLGEQSSKSLRGSKMEDVIFSGTSRRKGVGFAEVSLIIDNTNRLLDFDSDTVKVTRRYYRSGESEYLLNNATVRLRDVQLLFMDTGLGRDGYSIIGQGRITDIVSSKSEERREIFEEAAGIAKYRYRKNEAERRLKSAEENLLRLRDILQELEERIGPLKTQSEKAKKFLELAGEKKELEIGVWLKTLDNSRVTLRELDGKLELSRTQYDAAGTAIEAIEEEIETLAQTGRELAVEMDRLRIEKGTLEEEAVRCDGNASLFRNDIAHHLEDIARIRGEMEQSDLGNLRLDEEVEARRAVITAKQTEIAGAEQQRLSLSDEWEKLLRSSDEFSGKIEELSRRVAECVAALSDIRVKTVTAESSLSEITMRLSQVNAALSLRLQQSEGTREEKAACEEDYERLSEYVVELQNALKGYELRYNSRSLKLDTAKEEADRLRLDVEEKERRIRMLEEMERSMEGFAQSVKAVMKQAERGELRGIRGPVSRLIQAEGTYALAVETALGAAAQNIVCDREEDAKRGIAFLKNTKGGRATFLPIRSIRGNLLNEKGLENEDGFVGIAASLVQYDEEYRQIAYSLLGRIAVAEDLDYAVAIARKYDYRFRVVTLDGQVVNAGGSLTGGSHVKGAGLLSRRSEIERLTAEKETLTAKAEAAQEQFKAIREEVSAVQAELSGTQGELATAQEDKIRVEGELHRLDEVLSTNEEAIAALKAEAADLENRAAECRHVMETSSSETTAMNEKRQAAEDELTALDGGRQKLSEEREALAEKIADLKLAVMALQKEIEAEEAAITEIQLRKADQATAKTLLAQRVDELLAKNEELEAQALLLTEQAAQLREKAQATVTAVDTLAEQRMQGEARQTQLRQQSREKGDEREQCGRDVVRLEEKYAAAQKETDDILRRLYEEYELTRHQAEEIAKPIEDMGEATRRLTELKNKIRALGSVNVDAIEEYKEVSERYEFMSVQVNDVEVSREELLKLIGDLTVQMREMFIERFHQINTHFGTVFGELFDGGKAELVLTDPDDILHSGIEMKVQPPGKVILNMDSLSGGEKSLVATALLFAILKVTPSPFCVLDEIEAALDDVNVDRYAQYLRRMCDRSQFIVITHRRGTMEEADVLYGVTMQEEGVSKLLELRASEVEAKLGIKGNAPV